MAKLNRDRLFMITREKAATAAFALLDRIQDLSPEEQVAGMSVLFFAVCQRNGITGAEAHDLGEKLLRPQKFHRVANIQLETIQDFAGYTHTP